MMLRLLILVAVAALTVGTLAAFVLSPQQNEPAPVGGPDPAATPVSAATAEPSPTPATPTEAYARALETRQLGDWAAAAALFALASEGGPPLSGMASLRRAQALVEDGRAVEAVAAFEAALADPSLPPSVVPVAHAEAADALEDLGRATEALAHQAGVLASDEATRAQRGNAQWAQAQLLRGLADPGWANAALSAVAVAPGTAAATAALDALEDAGIEVPVAVAAFGRYRARRDDEATSLYSSLAAAPGSPEDAATAWFYLGAIAERSGDDEATGTAIAAYRQSLESDSAGALADDARWWLALLLEDEEPLTAAAELERLVEDFPGSTFAQRAMLRAGVVRAEFGDLEGAAARLRAAVNSGRPATGAVAARWLEALGLAVTGDPSPAAIDVTSFAAVLSHDPNLRAPLPAAALREWDSSTPSAPPSNDVSGWMIANFGEPPAESVVAGDSTLATGLALVNAGEGEVARALLADVVGRYRSQPHEMLALTEIADGAGLPDIAMSAAVALLDRLPVDRELAAPAVLQRNAYPLAFESEVRAAAAAEGVPPLLLLALVRQESGFNHNARSSADAIGLAQVIPPTAAQIANSLGVAWPTDLTQPATSLRFGAHYLAAQLEQFDGDLLMALAAYNGGPGNAVRWDEQQSLPGADGYVHAVDFEETHTYLERVVENYARYRHLYARSEFPGIR